MSYIPVLILLLVGITIGSAALALQYFIAPRAPHRRKELPFECGVPASGSAHQRFSVRFYLVAILFLLFDVESVFFFPWAIAYKKYLSVNLFILLEMVVFVGILLVGYFYVLRKGALEWE